MDIALSKRTQKIGLVVVVFLGLATLIYFVYFQQDIKKLDPIITQDTMIKDTLRSTPLSLYNTQDIQAQISDVKFKLAELKKKNPDTTPVVTQLTDKDIIVLFGNLTKQLGVDISNYKVNQDTGENINVDMTFAGHYQDLSLLFQALDHSKLSYSVSALEVKQIAPKASENQNGSLVYNWSRGKSTEVTNDLPLFLPSVLGILERKDTSVAATPTPTPSSAPLNSSVSTPSPAASPAPAPMPTPSASPTPQTATGTSGSASTKDQSNSSYDNVTVAYSDLSVQIKVSLSVSKYAVGLNLQNSKVSLGRNNPWAYLVPDNYKNYLGSTSTDFGNDGVSTGTSTPIDMARLLSSPDYVASEIKRTRSVIANRGTLAISTEQQLNYLYLLLFLDFKERSN